MAVCMEGGSAVSAGKSRSKAASTAMRPSSKNGGSFIDGARSEREQVIFRFQFRVRRVRQPSFRRLSLVEFPPGLPLPRAVSGTRAKGPRLPRRASSLHRAKAGDSQAAARLLRGVEATFRNPASFERVYSRRRFLVYSIRRGKAKAPRTPIQGLSVSRCFRARLSAKSLNGA